ncbi:MULTISPECIES: DUF982 domain-containing protein [Rhizobium]|uniref:DUF982 domain-containing protein n=1 Tax=Rhizobium terrae TaxID=2171756 RepID=UPI000DD8DFEB|nr:DUF982 domain-containing protein [Rhizobium terrae]
MLATRWKKPLILEKAGLRITLTSAEEAMNWLLHEPNQHRGSWRHAWHTCRAVHEGRLPANQARSAVQLAVEGLHQ